MKRKFVGLLLCFTLFSMSILTGCSLFSRNTNMFYDTVVATLEKDGKVINITKKELIETYSSYGSMYEQYYGYTAKEAYDMSLNIIENKKITIEEIKSLRGISDNGDGLEVKEKDYLWNETLDALFENLDSYYDSIVGENEAEEESDAITKEIYTKSAKIENGIIVKTSTEKTIMDSYDFDASNAHDYNNKEDKKLIYTNFIQFVTTADENYQKAFNQYRQALIASENGLNLSTDTLSLFEREIDRLYKIMFENYLVELYSEEFTDYSNISTVNINDILQLYSSKVRKGYIQYEIEQDSTYSETIQSDPSSLYYCKQNDETKYFTVANVLIKFDDEQQSKYNQLYEAFYGQSPDSGETPDVGENGYYGNYNKEEYEKDLNDLYDSLKYIVREKDNQGNNTYSEKGRQGNGDELLRIIQGGLSSGSNDEKSYWINEYLYLYNEDTGMINADSMYVIGVDSQGNAVSSFVEPFNDAAIKLYDNGNAKFGDVYGELVRTNYGIHILIYTGPVINDSITNIQKGIDENVDWTYQEGDENNSQSVIYALYNTRINPLVDKTYFDVLYDELNQSSSSAQSLYLEEAKNNYKITHYESRYSDLF